MLDKHKSYRKFMAASVTGVMVASAVSPQLAGAQQPVLFSDVAPKDYYYEAVTSLSKRGIVKGFGQGEFRPGEMVTRAQAAKMVALALDLKTDQLTDPGFKDVPKTNWAYRYITALNNAGILHGYGSQFKPNDPITRAQLAKILTLAFKLQESPLKDQRFTDVHAKDWFAGYVQPLIENKITLGTTANTFSPSQIVTRGQMAAFIYRSEQAVNTMQSAAVIKEITEEQLITDKGIFLLSPEQKKWITPDNAQILKNAVIHYQADEHVIEKIASIEIKASGKPAAENAAEFSGNLLFDGKGAVIEGNVKVSGDFLSLKNLTIMGDLEIAKEVENDFYMEDAIVHGKTLVNGGDSNTVVFKDSRLGSVDVNKPEVRVESLGHSAVGELAIHTNATITADSGVTFPKVSITGSASQINLQANIDSLTISSSKALNLTGSGNVNKLEVSSTVPVSLDYTGQVQTLSITQAKTSLAIGSNMQIQNLVTPAKVEAQQFVKNFEAIQSQVANLNGSANPAAAPRNNPPVQANPVSNKTINLEDGPIVIDVSEVFTDADQEPLTLTAMSRAPGVAAVQLAGTQLTITPAAAGTALIQMSATDGKQSAVSRFSVFVNTKPSGTDLPAQTLTLGSAGGTLDLSSYFQDGDGDTLTYTAVSDNPAITEADIDVSTLSISAVSAGTATVTVTADDGRGGTISKTLQVLVNRAPEAFLNIIDQTGTIGEPDIEIDIKNVFRDPDSDSLTYEVTSSHPSVAGASLDGTVVKLHPAGPGESAITIKARDGKGGSAEISFTINVNQAPAGTSIADHILTLGSEEKTIDLASVFSDPDGDALTYKVVSQDSSIAGAAVSGSLLKIKAETAGTSVITVTAEDGKGGKTSRSFTVRINRNPVASPIADQTLSLGSAARIIDLAQSFSDPDGDELSLSAVSADSSIAQAALTGKVLKISAIGTGETTLTVTASDSFGGTVSQAFSVTVKPNEAPVVQQVIGDRKSKPADEIVIDLADVFTDPEQDELIYEAESSNPSSSDAEISGSSLTVTGVQDGNAVITVTATDASGNKVSTTFTVTVSSNAAPSVSGSIPEQVIGAGVPGNQFSIDQLFSDSDGDQLTYSVTAADGALVNASINGNLLTLMPGTGYGKTTVTVQADDGNGGTATAAIRVNVTKVAQYKKITAKKGIADVSYDITSLFPAQNNLTVYRQIKGQLTQSGTQPLNGKVFKMVPGETGSIVNWWITAEDGTAVFIELTVQEQQGPEVFFSEYTRGEDGRIALEIYNKNDNALNYQVIGYRYNTKTSQMEIMKNSDITPQPFGRVSGIYPGMYGMVINYTFYDLMDIAPVPYYNDELAMTTNGKDGYVICAFELLKNGQVVDVIGDKNWTPGSPSEILPELGTMIRKKGIGTGSTSFDLSGEFDLMPTTYINLGNHTP
ncbi:S-layer homology domain-containing protein [Bacillus sp. MMSF_3328]|uniref:S-layer homology domain-containing protein n=1 Tax=Bacillus sp. MMSF_3328 TaxID=3047080 RepID=UPI00273D21FA|nr:S-layer homology domain-containing protein [Bacillus sp. MMSF_3328]